MLKTEDNMQRPKYEPGRLIVQFKKDAAHEIRKSMHEKAGTTVVGEIPEFNISIVAVKPGSETEQKNNYLLSPDVLHAEPNYYYYPLYLPKDPYYYLKTETSEGLQRQWGLRRIVPEYAWSRTHRLTPSVKIAVIDSGIDPNHPDLKDKIIDPYNFASDDPADYIDRTGHGTFVAGIAAAVTNNCQGIAGTSFNTAYIMPIRVGSTYYPLIPILQAIAYAVTHGAKVIQMSFGGSEFALIFQQFLDYAWYNGVLSVASAGNNGSEQVQYPAGYYRVLTVSATEQHNALSEFSSWGMDVGITAPGVAILSTSPTYAVPNYRLNYDAADGTSFSSPFVSGAAALLLAARPSLTNQDVIRILQKSASPLAEAPDFSLCEKELEAQSIRGQHTARKAWSPFFGHGLLNAGRAMEYALGYRRGSDTPGSFYGQVLSKDTGLPIGGATVSARIHGQSGIILRRYLTKNNVLSIDENLYADGMFRLMNIPIGEYDIYVRLPEQTSQKITTAAIAAGCDVFLRLYV